MVDVSASNRVVPKTALELSGLTGSRIKPSLEKGIKALEHLFVDAANVREPAPTGEVGTLASSLELQDELLHQLGLISVLLPEVPLASLCRLSLTVFSSESHCAPEIVQRKPWTKILAITFRLRLFDLNC